LFRKKRTAWSRESGSYLVLDTNILIGALLTKGTPPDRLYRAWEAGRYELCTSGRQIIEIKRVLGLPALGQVDTVRIVTARKAIKCLEI